MTTTETLPDAPFGFVVGGTETEALLGGLERIRATFRWKAADLDDAALHRTFPPSTMSIGGLLVHLAFLEDKTFTTDVDGSSPGEPWDRVDWDADPGWDWRTGQQRSAAEIYALYDAAVSRARRRTRAWLADGGLDRDIRMATPAGKHQNLRGLLVDLYEEYARHTGHVDLFREVVDGRVGEDAP